MYNNNNNNGAHTNSDTGSKQDVFHIICRMKSFICSDTIHTSAVQMCCHIVYHCMQKHKAKLLC